MQITYQLQKWEAIYIYIIILWLFVDCRYIKIYPTESTEALIPIDERTRTELRGSNCCGPIFSKDLQNLVNIVAWPDEEAAHREILHTRRTTETIALPRTDEASHAIMPYRREGTNWVNHSSVFYNSLRNRKNKSASLSRLMLKNSKSLYFRNGSQKRSHAHLLHGYI
jgi:hypothetical protein